MNHDKNIICTCSLYTILSLSVKFDQSWFSTCRDLAQTKTKKYRQTDRWMDRRPDKLAPVGVKRRVLQTRENKG